MPKYSPEQLKTYAAIVLADVAEGGDRGMQLLSAMCARTGYPVNEVVERIEGYLYA